jgi:TRAP-type C4-dicarboxylate transport system permease small subunit
VNRLFELFAVFVILPSFAVALIILFQWAEESYDMASDKFMPHQARDISKNFIVASIPVIAALTFLQSAVEQGDTSKKVDGDRGGQK